VDEVAHHMGEIGLFKVQFTYPSLHSSLFYFSCVNYPLNSHMHLGSY
jgi:hypothetical protein